MYVTVAKCSLSICVQFCPVVHLSLTLVYYMMHSSLCVLAPLLSIIFSTYYIVCIRSIILVYFFLVSVSRGDYPLQLLELVPPFFPVLPFFFFPIILLHFLYLHLPPFLQMDPARKSGELCKPLQGI